MITHTGNTTPGRERKIPLALDSLQIAIERLGKVSEDFISRIGHVLQPQPPAMPNNAKDVPEPPQAEYVENFNRKAQAINRIAEMLEDALSRLEL